MGDLLQKVHDKIEDLATLKIKTVVGSCTVEGETVEPNFTGAQIIYSKIDLVDGDITTVIDESFLTPERQSLKDFHMEREQQGRDIIRANIQTLGSLISLFKSVRSDLEQRDKGGDTTETT